MKKQIYLDYAASTPVDKQVLEAMMPYLRRHYGNPSSTHSFGQRARAAIEQARQQVADFLGCTADEIIFTSGATEANNLAIQGIARKYQVSSIKYQANPKAQNLKPHIVTTAIEHESVLEPCRMLEREGVAEVTYVKPQKNGVVRAKDVQEAIKANTVLVSVMYANSEIGTIQPVGQIGRIVAEKRSNSKGVYPVFHSDAVQAANFLDCNSENIHADLFTISGHKIYGPKGVGALYIRKRMPIAPLWEGGGQELQMRSGTENVAAIVGMGEAIKEIQNPKIKIQNIRIRQLRDKLIKAVLLRIPDSELTGSETERLANNAHFRFKGVNGHDLVVLLDQKRLAVSVGSACSEKQQEPSHVLLALGLTKNEALSAVRFTLGKQTKREEIDYAIHALSRAVAQLRKHNV